MELGKISTTGDPEGEITPVSDTIPAKKTLQEAVEQFRGQIEQVPPAFSAVKVGGQRAYKLARAGKEVKIEPRKVTINRLEIVSYDHPYVKFIADVSSGTYIRSLVEDIGTKLGVGAYTSQLQRLRIGSFEVAEAANMEQVGELTINNEYLRQI